MHISHIDPVPDARLALPASDEAIAARYIRHLFYAAATAAAAGVLLGQPHHARIVEPELAMVLRFMAGMKAAMALAALIAVRWRLRSPASPGRAAALTAAVALMAAAPGLIWGLAHVAAGAALFLPGFVLFCLSAIGDMPDPKRWTARAGSGG